ncbi:MAG: hypothetical protein MI717_14775 [Spirochaetales bacterium]|nr:hypothetical protein [Spirochaetales bacterium]
MKFSFPTGDDEREHMLPSVDLFLRAFEEADRLMAGSLGLELDYRRALKEMGETHFDYTIKLILHWPRQILLGSWPDPGHLRHWMTQARKSLFDAARGLGDSAQDVVQFWDAQAHQEGLSEVFVYEEPHVEALVPILEDLSRAVGVLGGENSVILD